MNSNKINTNTLWGGLQNDLATYKNFCEIEKAQSAYYRGDLNQCIQQCRKIESDVKIKALAKALHAACLKNEVESAELLSEALSLDPNCENAYFMLGQTHYKKQNYHEAIQHFKIYLNLNKSEEVYIQIVSAFLHMDNFEEAYNYVKEGLQFRRNSPKLNFLFVEIIMEAPDTLYTESEYKSVLKCLEKAKSGGVPKNSILWYEAQYLYKRKEYAKAYESISEYLHINYYDNEARWLHNMCLFYLGDLINFVGYVLELYDESDNFAIHLVNKYNLLDFEEEVFKDSFTKEQVLDLNKRILFRVRDLNQSK